MIAAICEKIDEAQLVGERSDCKVYQRRKIMHSKEILWLIFGSRRTLRGNGGESEVDATVCMGSPS